MASFRVPGLCSRTLKTPQDQLIYLTFSATLGVEHTNLPYDRQSDRDQGYTGTALWSAVNTTQIALNPNQCF